MWETAGAASGAVLGFTAGNIPGAYMGYKVGKYLGKRRRMSASKPYANKRRRTTTVSKKSITFDGTTNQYDSRVAYRKKRMPKGKRKAWKKFVKKVSAVEIGDRGLQTLKYNPSSVGPTTVPPLGQNFKVCHLYGCSDTTSEPGCRDLSLIAKDIETMGVNWIKLTLGAVNPTVPQVYNTQHIRMQSAVLDLYLKNTGTTTLLFDVYHLWYVKNNNAPSLLDATNWVEFAEQRKQEWDGSTVTDLSPVNMNTFNCTMFDEAQLISKLGATIRSVREVYLAPGQVHHMQIRDPKNHSINLFNYVRQVGQSYAGYVDPKLTETYVAVAKNLDTTTEGSYTFNACRTYRFTVEGVKTTASGFKTYT